MPEVGVLNLTIHDNSETAAEGLNHLTDALVSIQSAIGNGLKLSGISGPLNKFASAVSANSKTFSNVGTFLNAMKDYQKAFKDAENVKFNTQPIKDLKEAISDGIKIGNAGTQINKIKEALGGGWDTAQSANIKTVLQDIAEGAKSFQGTNLGTTAKNVSATAKALSEYAEASRQIKDVLGTSQNRTLEDMANTPSRLKLNLQLHGGTGDFAKFKSETKEITDTYKTYVNDIDTLSKKQEQVSDVKTNFESATKVLNLEDVERAGMVFDVLQHRFVSAGDAAGGLKTQLEDTKVTYDNLSAVAKNAIDLTKVPASGQNGEFAHAGEEVRYLTEEVEKNKLSLSQWEEIYAKTQKRIKYNGATEERTNMLGHAEEGFYIAIANIEQYGNALNSVLGYAKEYIANEQKMTAETKAHEERVRALAEAHKRYMEAAQGSANTVAIKNIFEGLERVPDIKFADIVNNINGVDRVAKSAKDSMSAFLSGMQDGSKYGQYIANINPELAEVSKRFTDAEVAAKAYASELKNTIKENNAFGFSFKDLGTGMKKLFPTITHLVQRFKGMAIMRAMRYMIRQISAGFSEGVQNVYGYSKAIGGSFAPAMDSAATALQQMKNSLGAALAPAIQAIIPYVNQLVNWFINLVNYVNQFFALLNGQASWTRALPATTQAFDKQTKAAKGAGAAMKDLLADWDELNIIQSQTGGGGGAGSGKTAEDYLKMFEEVNTFDNTVKKITKYVNDNMDDLLGMLKKAGVALLGWKFSKAFTGLLGTLGGLIGGVSTIGLVFDVSTKMTEQYLDTGDAGWLVGDVLTTLLGGVIAKKILGKVLGGALASYAIPISFGVSAAATIKTLVEDADTTALSEKSIIASIAAGIEGAVATGGTLYALGVGATAGEIAGTAVGGALFTFGLSVGLKAIADTVDAGEITKDTIKANLLSAGSIGAGLAISTAVLSNATIGTILGVGATGAVLTLGALFAIQAIIASQPERIAWGDIRLTQQEIQTFVETEMMNKDFNLPANLQISAKQVELLEKDKQDLEGKVKELVPPVSALRLGVNVDESLTEIDSIVNGAGGVVEQFNNLQKDKKNRINVAIAAVFPEATGDDKDSPAAKYAQIFGESYSMMEGVMTNLGQDLATALGDAYNEKLTPEAREMAKNTVIEITNAINQVTAIDTANKTKQSLRNKLTTGLMDQESMEGILEYYNSQVEATKAYVTQEFQSLIDEAELNVMNYEEYAKLAEENGGMFAGYTTQEYLDMANNFKDNLEEMKKIRDETVTAAIEFYTSGDGYQLVRDAMLKYTEGHEAVPKVLEYLKEVWFGDGSATTWDSELDPKNEISSALTTWITNGFAKADRSTVRLALQSGVLKFSDFITGEMASQFANELGISGEARDIWDKYISELLGVDISSLINRRLKPKVEEEPVKALSGSEIEDILRTPLFTKPVEETIPVDATLEIDISQSSIEQARKDIQDALNNNGKMDEFELEMLYTKYKPELIQNAWDQLLNEGMNPDGTFGKIPAGMRVASTGINYGPNNVPVNYAPSGENNTIVTEPKDPQQEISNTASGVERGNRNLEGLMRDLLAAMNRVGDRPITVSLFPSSGWGSTNRQSEKKMEEVTGYNG